LRSFYPNVRLHDLGHLFASFLENQGVSLYVVHALLGHASPHSAAPGRDQSSLHQHWHSHLSRSCVRVHHRCSPPGSPTGGVCPGSPAHIIGGDFAILARNLVLDVVRSGITGVSRIENPPEQPFLGWATGNLIGREFGLPHRQKPGLRWLRRRGRSAALPARKYSCVCRSMIAQLKWLIRDRLHALVIGGLGKRGGDSQASNGTGKKKPAPSIPPKRAPTYAIPTDRNPLAAASLTSRLLDQSVT
jgi:hypothetical protein